jgi:MoaA/NifB/PqqE/SkfB family radical SAM enzyme
MTVGSHQGAARLGSRLLKAAPSRVRDSYALRRAGRRLLQRPASAEVPERPIGAKLELTYHCNLRCSFCYTDSPRRTLARTAEMGDEEWHRIVDQAIELGVIESVVTGGEPLLRRDLTLEVVERLTGSGVMTTLNTNGWFVDEAVAERLASSGARVHVSIDGVSAELHDASRGVRGSWRRAVDAIDMLLSRGVRVQVVHVVTPRNETTFGELLEQMRILGPSSLRVTPVGKIGAASRGGEWAVDVSALRRRIDRFDPASRPRVLLNDTVAGSLVAVDRAPEAFLVRPNGAFLADSQHPFSFGHAARQPLAECWGGLRESWRSERVEGWRRGARNPDQAAARDLVAYRDEEEPVAGVAPEHGSTKKGGRELERALELLATKAPEFPADARGEVGAASGRVRDLALRRQYRLAPVRWSGSSSGQRLVRVIASGEVRALNASAGQVMDALDGGSAEDATTALLRANPGLDRARAEVDALTAVGALVEAGIAVPSLAPRDDLARAADEGSLSGLPD